MSRKKENQRIFNPLIVPTVHYAIQNGMKMDEINCILNMDVANQEFPDFRIKPARYAALLEKLQEKTKDNYLGIHIGELIKPDHLGILGYLLMNCANAGEVIDKLKKYHLIIGNVVELQVYPFEADQVECRLSLQNEHLFRVRREILEGYIVGFLKLYHQLTSGYRYVNEIHFDWSISATDRSEYGQVLPATLKFNQPSPAIIFDPACRLQPVISSNTKLKAVFEAYAEKCYQELRSDRFYSDAVVRILSSRIADMPGIDDIAFRMGLSGRSLQNKLKSESTAFNGLQDKVRFEFVKTYLELRGEMGDKVVEVYEGGDILPVDNIFSLPVDTLIKLVKSNAGFTLLPQLAVDNLAPEEV